MSTTLQRNLFIVLVFLTHLTQAADSDTLVLDDVLILENTSFANNLTSPSMLAQQSALSSINAVIDNLPGVTVNEGDAYGFDDYSTAITLRGFSLNLTDQQIGTTIDGMPNGNSNYGGGSKANRYIDPANLAGVEVFQGTADIASRSNEALGGTLNFKTSDPLSEQNLELSATTGSFAARRLYFRYDTGNLGSQDTRAWVSFSHQSASDWMQQTAENDRDHIAAKLVSNHDKVDLTAYVSYDDVHEDNYQGIYSEYQYDNLPKTDGLTDTWTGVPFEDQLYRQGWSTLRENLFGYLKMDMEVNDQMSLTSSLYHHQNDGRGDWLPPYLVDATFELGPQSEFLGTSTHRGTPAGVFGQYFFVDANGNALAPDPTCTSSYTVTNFYGQPIATAPIAADPSCYPDGAIAVQSVRQTHYQKDRTGFSLDSHLDFTIGNVDHALRAGVWYEDQTRDESREWHSVDTTQALTYRDTPYWIQYDREYKQKTRKWYVQDAVELGSFTFNIGAKQFLVDLNRKDRFDASQNTSIDSDSDVLYSAGILWQTPIVGMQAFANYAENYKALSDLVLEQTAADFSQAKPETSKNYELGLRYRSPTLTATAVYFKSDFENRLFFLPSTIPGAGPDFLASADGRWFNAGGIKTNGLELAARYAINHHFNAYAAYTYTDAVYVGTGDAVIDAVNGVTPSNKVAGIPKNMLVATLNWQKKNASASLSTKYTGKREVDLANTWSADAYTITDLSIGYSFKPHAGSIKRCQVSLIVNNLFNQTYLGTITGNAAWLGSERSVALAGVINF